MRNQCKECIYYHKENNTCQSKKCATGGDGTVTLFDRMFCEPMVRVRCENCKHSNEAPFPRKDRLCKAHGVYCTSDGFCANWERKR